MASLVDRLPPSLRGLTRQKRFATLGILSLGIAIALNTTMYSVTDALLFPKIAMREPERLYNMYFYGDYHARLTEQDKGEVISKFSFIEGSAYLRGNYGAQNFAEFGTQGRTARVLNVGTTYFELLGVEPLAGRLFSKADFDSPARPVVVSERFWRQMFPDRRLGDTVTFTLDADPRTVIGVLAYESDFPGTMTDIWQLPKASEFDAMAYRYGIYRVKPGLSLEKAYAEMNAAAAKLGVLSGEGPASARFDIEKTVRAGPMRFQGFHYAVIGAVAFVLFVACFNLANLQFARGLARTREMATRAAVGATRAQLVWLLVSESAWIALGSIIVGVILTFWGIHIVKSQLPPTLETFLVRPQVNWRLFVFAGATGALALAIVGLIPALRASRVDVNELMKSGAGTGANRRSRWQAGGLVVLQVGLALALMAGAALLIRSAVSLYQLDINPALERVSSASIGVKGVGPQDRRSLQQVSQQLINTAFTIPGVTEAATIRSTQPSKHVVSVSVEGALPREIATGAMWGYRIVSDAYLSVYRMKILKGRGFEPGEVGRSVVMDAQTAKYFWPNSDPIGQQLKFGSDARRDSTWFTVVGIVKYQNTWATFRSANQSERVEAMLGVVLALNTADTAHLSTTRPLGGGGEKYLSLAVSSSGSSLRMPMLIRRTFTDPGVGFRVVNSQRLADALGLDNARQMQNFVAAMFTTFALIALFLSALGVYAVVSHTVSERTREFGVRLALGASETRIRQSVLFHGNVMALSGIAVGEVIGLSTVQFLSRFLREVRPSEVIGLFLVAAATLFATTLFASYMPALRAMRINPVEALRHE